MAAIAMYRMNFNKKGPIDPQLFKMCKDAHVYQESFKKPDVNSLVNEMTQMTLNEPDLFKLADEIGNYFEMEALVEEMARMSLS